ncbi:MAG: hypothetical protein K2W97_07915 [Chthoniobacterales bacterium]|nr:hypothetical protein [Chthoniobacterales bacterium]
MGNIAAMAESMAATSMDGQQSLTAATANTYTSPGTDHTFSSAPGNSLIIDSPGAGAPGPGITAGGPGVGTTLVGAGGLGGISGPGGFGGGHAGAAVAGYKASSGPGGLGGVGGPEGVSNPGAAILGYSMKQLAQEYPQAAAEITSLVQAGDLQSAAADHPNATADVKGAINSEVKSTTKDIADHPFAVDEMRTPGAVGGPGQPGGVGGLQHPLGDLAAKSVEQLANEYPDVANYVQGLSAQEMKSDAQETSETAVRDQMQADTPTNILA